MFNCDKCKNWAVSPKQEPCNKCTDNQGAHKEGTGFEFKTPRKDQLKGRGLRSILAIMEKMQEIEEKEGACTHCK